MSVQHIWKLSQQIYLETSSLKRANNVPKLPGEDYVVILPIAFRKVCSENSREIGQFFRDLLEALHSMALSENTMDRSRYKSGGKLAFLMRFGTFFMMKAKQDNFKCLCFTLLI